MLALPQSMTNDGSAYAALVALRTAAPKTGEIQLDASGLRRLDSSCVAALIGLQREWAARDQSMIVFGAPAGLESLIRVYGVETLLGLRPATA